MTKFSIGMGGYGNPGEIFDPSMVGGFDPNQNLGYDPNLDPQFIQQL